LEQFEKKELRTRLNVESRKVEGKSGRKVKRRGTEDAEKKWARRGRLWIHQDTSLRVTGAYTAVLPLPVKI